MSQIPSLGTLLEGHLRKGDDDGSFQIEQPDGSLVDLETILAQYLDKEVRFTMVGLKELDAIAAMLKTQ